MKTKKESDTQVAHIKIFGIQLNGYKRVIYISDNIPKP